MANEKVNSVQFSHVGTIAQALKHQIRSGMGWEDLSPASKESLDQIATLIARIVSGEHQHWDAIISYAQAVRPGEAPTADLERNIRNIVRDIPRNDAS